MTDNKLKKSAEIDVYLKLVAGKKKLVGNGCFIFYLEKKVSIPVRTSSPLIGTDDTSSNIGPKEPLPIPSKKSE